MKRTKRQCGIDALLTGAMTLVTGAIGPSMVDRGAAFFIMFCCLIGIVASGGLAYVYFEYDMLSKFDDDSRND